VIGGDVSFRGAHHLCKHFKGQVIGLPGTIDKDISATDATIGFYTAIETALDPIDNS
jgi:6-phosphofructokinase 1